MTPDANDLCVFATKRGRIEGRIDINYNLPKYTELSNQLKLRFGNALKRLGDIADVICGPFGSAIRNSDYRDDGIPLIRIANITKDGYMDYSDLVYISEQHGNNLKRTQVSSGDIVISQRGTLGQCAVVDNRFPVLNISANIIAIKNIKNTTATFIRNYILSLVGQKQLERNISGQVQKKINTSDISEILIPIQCGDAKIDQILNNAYLCYKQQLQQADELLAEFEADTARQYGLEQGDGTKLCTAVKYKDLDGVIDVKRYMNVKGKSDLHISDFCDIIDEKVNADSYEDQIVDWIRIDDLPNRPLDVVLVRTQSAREIDGIFFKVQLGDILVARLGPTILNQKIVIVRTLERTTIASSEFLVLRCKEGYDPEAVMTLLKTPYYRDLMYSHARGSTPSRYRLNREDMLKLPFPDIRKYQAKLAKGAIELRKITKTMRVQAEEDWKIAKIQFEKELLGE